MDGLYSYELPEMPPERDILFVDAPKKNQYWETKHSTDFAKWFNADGWVKNVKQMSERDRIEYIDFWRDKYLNGLWFMSNGVPTWISGAHVDHLVFNKHKAIPYMYMDSQKDRFYFRDKTNRESSCDGRLWVKGRRCGITEEQVTENVRVINADFGNHVALQSDSEEKGNISLMQKVINVHIKRPEWMREIFYSSNGKIPRASLELISNVLVKEDDYPLGGTARKFPATAQAIDGLEFMLVTMDELSKWKTSLPMQTFEVNIKTIINPGKRGKLDALSTTGDSDLVQKAVKDWHTLISNSNPRVLNDNGKTNSGLWYYFVSYVHSFELYEKFANDGKIRELYDLYGNVNKERAEEYIWNEIKKYPKDSKEYIFSLYKQPMEMRHALLTPTGQGYFSKVRITNRLEELRGLPNDRKPYVWGSLEYLPNGGVYFESNAEREIRCKNDGTEYKSGYWQVAIHPYKSVERNIDASNRWRKINGVFFPPSNIEFGGGYDPIRYKKEDTSSNSLSKGSIIIAKLHDYYGAGDANRYAALWLHRPDDPSDANKEAIKACKYWGCLMGHERVIETVKTDFVDANCLPFLAINPKDGLYGFWIDSQGKIVKNALDWMVTKFSPPKTDDDVDQIAEMPFEDCLMDMDSFDISNTTLFDTFMAMVELEHTLKLIPFTNVSDNSDMTKLKVMQEIFAPRNK